jgi:putative resolvase
LARPPRMRAGEDFVAFQACQDPSVTELWVTHQERLARFGVGIIEQLLYPHGVRVVAIGEDEALSDSVESELFRDMLAVVTSFSDRLYGERSAKAKAIRRCAAEGTKL